MTTNLDLGVMASTPYATRGLQQTLEVIEASKQMRRTVNGTLIDISLTQFHKYRSVITGNDQLPPAFDGFWPGQTITVQCVAELSYLTSGGSPAKTVVAGSSRTDGDFTFYRPELTMKVVSFNTFTDEYRASVTWVLELEEV
ncbi:MAG: hypothetical protein ACWGQW_02770 [bacterium]